MGESEPSEAQEIHREELVHLVDLSHDRVLIAWGAPPRCRGEQCIFMSARLSVLLG